MKKHTYTLVENDLYVEMTAEKRLQQGSEELAYITVTNDEDYVKVSKYAFQPAKKLDENAFKVSYILE